MTDDETAHLRQSLLDGCYAVLAEVDGPDIDTGLIFEKIEAALRKHLNLTFAQCDYVLADARADIERAIAGELDGAIDFHDAVSAVEDLINEELGGDDEPDPRSPVTDPPSRLQVIK
jgi:hypothetical protein